MTRIHYYLLLA